MIDRIKIDTEEGQTFFWLRNVGMDLEAMIWFLETLNGDAEPESEEDEEMIEAFERADIDEELIVNAREALNELSAQVSTEAGKLKDEAVEEGYE